MNDFRNIDFHELVERLDLMTNNLSSIGLSDIRFQNMTVVRQEFGNRRHGVSRINGGYKKMDGGVQSIF